MKNKMEDSMKSEMEAEASAMAIAQLKSLQEINIYEKMEQLEKSKSISDNATNFSDGIHMRELLQ